MEEAYDIRQGDCREVMREMPEKSVDAIVTDPPYGLSFMGKEWDHGVPGVQFWTEAMRVAKPGAHLLAFGGTRTFHRLTCAIEDAGWEIRDCVMWVYGSGFPKSHDVSKAIDKDAGHWRGRAGEVVSGNNAMSGGNYERTPKGDSVTDAARQWSGWGTALKPAWEPIIVARKPLCGTVAENVLKHGTGGINVDGCRVEGGGPSGLKPYTRNTTPEVYALGMAKVGREVTYTDHPLGRWPANVIHDGSDEVVGLFPVTSSGARNGPSDRSLEDESPSGWGGTIRRGGYGVASTGSAARFFYCAKASKADRDAGCDGMPIVTADPYGQHRGRRMQDNDVRFDGKPPSRGRNTHPTVKPTDLMRYLCRLVTPPGGVVLDPFMGSGSTGKAAMMEGFRFIGIELNPEYIEIARARIAQAARESVTMF